jgi:Glycosyltransferase family 87
MIPRDVANRPITLKSTRPAALALALVLGGCAVWVLTMPGPLDRFGTLKGSDFSQFYVAARLAVTGRLDALYDWEVFARELAKAVPGPVGLLYLSVYPPQLALLLVPIARLGYFPALLLWTVVSAALYLLAGGLLVRSSPGLRRDPSSVALLLFGFPALQQVLLNGQIGTLATLTVALGWLAWRRDAYWLAGLALGSLAFKPPLLTIAAAACVLAPGWRLWAGVAAGIGAQFVAVWAAGGLDLWRGYGSAAARVLASPAQFEPKLGQMQSVRGFFELSLGPGLAATALFAAAAVLVLALGRRIVIRCPDREVVFSTLVASGLLLDPHLYAYDLVVLAVPLGLLAGWVVDAQPIDRARPVARAAWLLYWVPLVAPLSAAVRIQVATPAMVWLLWTLLRAAAAPAIGSRGIAASSRLERGEPPSSSPVAAPRS